MAVKSLLGNDDFFSRANSPKGLNEQQDGTRPISTKIALQKEYPVAFKPMAY
ncbi:hypothetical protein [Pedobacter jeongneungensis]|uniref:hypothetical protein n=1 Tax=Pedobacter jeongneungensis TaxID=947309 RepID=UPI0031E9F923